LIRKNSTTILRRSKKKNKQKTYPSISAKP